MKIELIGKIDTGGDYSELYIGDNMLSAQMVCFDQEKCKVMYYISDKPIDKEKVVENMLLTYYGNTEVDSTYISGSSWTGVYSRNDIVEVGGHDIVNELAQHINEYCYLIAETYEEK